MGFTQELKLSEYNFRKEKDIVSDEDAKKNLDIEPQEINYGKCDLCHKEIKSEHFGPAILKAYDMKLKVHPECIIAGQIEQLRNMTPWFMFHMRNK